jgi:predicted homoserine dehydrogenase-like protein
VELVAVADRDLKAGETLALSAASHGVDSLEPRLKPPQRMESDDGYVPYYLAAGHAMARDIAKGEILRLDDVLIPRDTVLFK